MRFPLQTFARFCAHLPIPSKDEGIIPMRALLGTQQYMAMELARGLEDGVHEFIGLSGRQVGKTTFMDALDLFWLQRYDGMTGYLISDDDSNRDYRRDVLRQMLMASDAEYRINTEMDNSGILRFSNGSRLMFAAVGKRLSTSFGRSRGLNYCHGDEVGDWPDPRAVMALRAAFSRKHPHRLYTFFSTAQGYGGAFHDLWKTAQTAVTQRAIFVGWWWHDGYTLDPADRELWERYATEDPTEDEQGWMRAVHRRYGKVLTMAHLGWRRWQLEEEFSGNEDMCAQEFPNLPEDAWVSFGSKHFAPATIARLRRHLDDAPPPTGLRYVWSRHLDTCRLEACEPETAPLLIWEEPDPEGVYLIGQVTAGSYDPNAKDNVTTVWRIYPDQMVQVAEYRSDSDVTYQAAWATLHLCGAYNMVTAPFMAMEVQATGRRVFEEIQRFSEWGFGLSPKARAEGREIIDFLGSIRHYLYRRSDTMTRTASRQWLSTPTLRAIVLHEFRDQVERGYVVIRSRALVDEMAMLRRGEDGDNDRIAAGEDAEIRDGRVSAAAIAARYFVETAMPEIEHLIPPKDTPRAAPRTVGESMVRSHLQAITAARG